MTRSLTCQKIQQRCQHVCNPGARASVLEPNWMMIACGPFCAGCSSLLRVEACQRCARAKAATDAERFFDTLEACAHRGGSHCVNGVVLSARPVRQCIRPKDVQRLAAVCERRYPRGVLAFHLGERACCLFKHGTQPVLVELADAVTHLMAPPALAYVVLGWGGASLDVSCV